MEEKIGIVYIVLNLIAGLFYAMDKIKAIRQTWRIKERTLLMLTWIGPFGALTGMKIFRHKTQKLKFNVIVILACVLHIAFAAYMIS